jgi:hypothetical protein
VRRDTHSYASRSIDGTGGLSSRCSACGRRQGVDDTNPSPTRQSKGAAVAAPFWPPRRLNSAALVRTCCTSSCVAWRRYRRRVAERLHGGRPGVGDCRRVSESVECRRRCRLLEARRLTRNRRKKRSPRWPRVAFQRLPPGRSVSSARTLHIRQHRGNPEGQEHERRPVHAPAMWDRDTIVIAAATTPSNTADQCCNCSRRDIRADIGCLWVALRVRALRVLSRRTILLLAMVTFSDC